MSGIPYMGSKRKLAEPIVSYILAHNPNAKYIFDLFGGGGAISFEALKRNQFLEVHYNELNTGVVELLKKIRTEGVTPEFYNWIDRETFNKHKNDDDWYGGFLKTCWSFGNNQKGYMYGFDIVDWKKALHNICFAETEAEIIHNFRILEKRFFKKPVDYTIFFDDKRAIELLQLAKGSERRYNLRNCVLNRSVDGLESLQRLERLERLERLQRLESLESLQRLQRLESLENLKITNLSYEQVQINTPINETIIYCDPPYLNTAKYQEEMCQNTLINWIKQSPYKIYLSSYNFPLPIVKEFIHSSTFSSTTRNKTIERLFCNKLETIKTELF